MQKLLDSLPFNRDFSAPQRVHECSQLQRGTLNSEAEPGEPSWKCPVSALVSGVLLVLFGLAMAVFTGMKGPLDYSVFAASAAALLLYECLGATSAERKSRMSDSGTLGD